MCPKARLAMHVIQLYDCMIANKGPHDADPYISINLNHGAPAALGDNCPKRGHNKAHLAGDHVVFV